MNRPSYKQTLFDRYGPDAGLMIQASFRSFSAAGLSFPVILALGAKYELKGWPFVAVIILGPILVGLGTYRFTMWLFDRSRDAVKAVLEGSSGSTPYTQQNSIQQAMVMQGRTDDALASYEGLIAEESSSVAVRLQAAEVYTREAKKHERAAELFREAIRHPSVTPAEEAYAVNRLVDLLIGPLNQPGRALVELRRLIDRYPNSSIGHKARESLKAIKERHLAATAGDR